MYQEWDLARWNQKLFESVFTARGPGRRPVRRINVTPGFLAKVGEVTESEGETVRDAFLVKVRQRFPQGRGLFDPWRLKRSWDLVHEIPPFFCSLYVSLIAASATEETHQEGNFRRRLAMLLEIPAYRNRVTYDLPRLWEALRDWTEGDFAARHGYRPLVLPDPGHETIIGYSKRLAFPPFRDLDLLTRAMTEADLGVDSSLAEIVNGVGRYRARFGSPFRREYDRFRELAVKGDAACVDTRFWDALSEVTWQHESEQDPPSGPRASLGMDVADLWNPRLMLLFDEAEFSGERKGTEVRLHGSGTIRHALISDEAWQLLDDPSHPWREGLGAATQAGIRSGCLGFKVGEQVEWEETSRLPWTGPVWIACEERWTRHLRRAGSGILKEIQVQRIPAAQSWHLCGPFRYDRENFEAFLHGLPTGMRALPLFSPGVPTVGIRLKGAIRLPDGVLALPARLPRVWAGDAEAVTVVRDSEEEEVGISLSKGEDGLFDIPDVEAKRLVAGDYRIEALGPDGIVLAVRELHFIRTYSGPVAPSQPASKGAWLVECADGQLCPLSGERAEPLRDIDRNLAGRLKGSLASTTDRVGTRWSELGAAIPPDWDDLLEVLTAWSSQRAGFVWSEIEDLVVKGLRCAPERAYQVIDGLVDNGFVDRLYSRRWKGSRFFVRAPRASATRVSAGAEYRITGATSRMWRNRLMRTIDGTQLIAEVAVCGESDGVGAIRVRGDDTDVLEELLIRLSLPIASPEIRGMPRRRALVTEPTEDTVAGSEVTVFDPDLCIFVPAEEAGVVEEGDWRLERCRFESRQTQYRLLHGSTVIWLSRSRRWAGLLAGFVSGRPLWRVQANGIVESRWPFPLSMTRYVLTSAGGVCGASWREPSLRRWYYSFGSKAAAQAALSDWLLTEESQPDDALDFWLEALRAHEQAPPLWGLPWAQRPDG